MSSSSPYSSERYSDHWDSTDTTTSDPPASDGRLFVIVTRERDTVGPDLTCYSFAVAFLVVTVVSMVLFASRHRRRLLNEESLVADSEDRDGAKGEAALREAARRNRKEDASATRSRRTSRQFVTDAAVAGRRAHDIVVPVLKNITAPRTLNPSDSRKPTRKFTGYPHEDELVWKKKRVSEAGVDERTDDRRHSEPVTTAGGTAPGIFPSKSTPHRMLFTNSATATAKTTVLPEPATKTSTIASGTSLVAAGTFRGEAFAGNDFPAFTVPADVPITALNLTPYTATIFPASMPSLDVEEHGVSNPSMTVMPITTRSDLQSSTTLKTTSLGSASASPSRVAEYFSLDGIVAHTEPFPDDASNPPP